MKSLILAAHPQPMTIKVLHLISSPYGIGGAERLLLDMAGFYDRRKFTVYYCNILNNPSDLSPFTKALGRINLQQFIIPGDRWYRVPGIVYELSKIIRKHGINIVHTHLVHSTIIGAALYQLSSRHKTIVTRHYTASSLAKPLMKALDRKVSNATDLSVAISSAVKEDLLRLGVKEGKIRIVPNGIDLASHDRESRVRNELFAHLKSQGKYIIGSVGNLHKVKDHATLLYAMSQVVKVKPHAHLVIVGEGPERQSLERVMSENGLEANVSLLGFQNNVASILSGLDLYVHSAKQEAFGIAILEALAARKGVIATRVGGVADIINDGVDGVLIPAQSPELMADSIIQAINSPARMEEMGLRGRRKVEEFFSIQNVTIQYQNLYQEIMN